MNQLLSIRFLQTQPDGRLVALARAGHERAFEALVRRYRKQLLGYCGRIGSPGANAEDALQQTFLQAWLALRTGLEVRDARAWLYRIAHNVVISSVRQQPATATDLDARFAARGADDEAEQRIAVREALAGLASLPRLQREVMVGTAVEGLTHAQIARELGLTNGAVRGLIYRARSTLRVAAALFIPGPVVHWAARQGAPRASASPMYEALAGGGGSAGLGGVLLKGGVITATAGMLATAGGVVSHHTAHHPHRQAVQVLAVPAESHGSGGHAVTATRAGFAPAAATSVEVVAAVPASWVGAPTRAPTIRAASPTPAHLQAQPRPRPNPASATSRRHGDEGALPQRSSGSPTSASGFPAGEQSGAAHQQRGNSGPSDGGGSTSDGGGTPTAGHVISPTDQHVNDISPHASYAASHAGDGQSYASQGGANPSTHDS